MASEYCQTLLTGLAIIVYNTCRTLPRVRALYDYEAADVDEISIREGDVFELVQEREYLDIYLDIHTISSAISTQYLLDRRDRMVDR